MNKILWLRILFKIVIYILKILNPKDIVTGDCLKCYIRNVWYLGRACAWKGVFVHSKKKLLTSFSFADRCVYAKHEPTFETLRPHPGTRARMTKLGNYDRMCLVIIITRIEIAIVRFTVNVPDCSPTQWLLSSGADRDSKSSKKNSENNNIQKNNFVTDYGFRLWQASS